MHADNRHTPHPPLHGVSWKVMQGRLYTPMIDSREGHTGPKTPPHLSRLRGGFLSVSCPLEPRAQGSRGHGGKRGHPNPEQQAVRARACVWNATFSVALCGLFATTPALAAASQHARAA